MIIQINEGTWYDNFADASVGAGVPSGWSVLGSPPVPVTVAADVTANGGKRVEFTPGSTPYGFVMTSDLTGAPESFEVLVRLRASTECTGEHPNYGGPGGRLSVDDGWWLKGISLSAQNKKSYTTCTLPCQLKLERAQSWNPVQYLAVRVRGDLSVVPTPPAPDDEFGVYEMTQAGGFQGGLTAIQASDGIETPGNVVSWHHMRLRVDAINEEGNPTSRVRAKWWKTTEPGVWLIDTKVINLYWPSIAGAVGMLIANADNCGAKTYLDYIVITIDPDTYGSPEEQNPRITNNCPLDDGIVGTAYSVQLEVEGL